MLQFELVYLDSIVLFSKTLQKQVGNVHNILLLLQSAGAIIKLKKWN